MIDNARFNIIAKACGSSYLATMWVAKCARRLASSLPNYVIESKLIHWVLSDEEPDISKIIIPKNYELEQIKWFLSDVEDEDVVECVVDSYRSSICEHHLIYQYTESLDEFQKSRVRILLRMIWYDISIE